MLQIPQDEIYGGDTQSCSIQVMWAKTFDDNLSKPCLTELQTRLHEPLDPDLLSALTGLICSESQLEWQPFSETLI